MRELMLEQASVSSVGDSDFATSKVPESATVGGVSIGMINGCIAFSVPGLVTGIELGNALGLTQSIYAFLIGGLILSILGFVTGLVGKRNRLTSCMTLKFVFGKHGSALISALFVFSLLGWFGVNLDLFSESIARLCESLWAVSPSLISIEFVTGLLITIATIWGFKLIETLSNWLVPVMFFALIFMCYQSFQYQSDPQTLSNFPSLGFGESVSIVVGSFIVSVVLMPDFTRFAATDNDTATASFLPFLGISSFVYIVSAIAGIAVSENNVLSVMLLLGLGWIAFLLLILASWITNVINLYSAVLGANALHTQWKERHLVIIMGICGTVVASFNLLDNFTDFLFSLSAVFTPVAAIYSVDFFIIRKLKTYELIELETISAINWKAIIAWLAGIATSLLANGGYYVASGIEVVDALVVSSCLYLLLNTLFNKPKALTNNAKNALK